MGGSRHHPSRLDSILLLAPPLKNYLYAHVCMYIYIYTKTLGVGARDIATNRKVVDSIPDEMNEFFFQFT
jgi:hypothetical protein